LCGFEEDAQLLKFRRNVDRPTAPDLESRYLKQESGIFYFSSEGNDKNKSEISNYDLGILKTYFGSTGIPKRCDTVLPSFSKNPCDISLKPYNLSVSN